MQNCFKWNGLYTIGKSAKAFPIADETADAKRHLKSCEFPITGSTIE